MRILVQVMCCGNMIINRESSIGRNRKRRYCVFEVGPSLGLGLRLRLRLRLRLGLRLDLVCVEPVVCSLDP